MRTRFLILHLQCRIPHRSDRNGGGTGKGFEVGKGSEKSEGVWMELEEASGNY